MDAARQAAVREGGSFRDPAGAVFVRGDTVLRALTADGLADWNAVSATGAFERAIARGAVVATRLAEPSAELDGYAAALEHERLPFVSYPFEWPFAMLRDAALLTLDLLEDALADDVILKDASPYNVQWRGSQPVFVDVGSFEPLRAGQPWMGYRQFCMQFLYPLMLQAYKGVSYRPWLRGSLRGIPADQLARLMTRRDRLRPGVFAHVYLHHRLERREGRSGDVEQELRQAGFRKELIAANVARLRKTVERLAWKPAASPWTRYREESSYSAEDEAAKVAFVETVLGSSEPTRVWDLGCNDGRYSRLAAGRGAYVVAADADEAVVDALYRELAAAGEQRILPLVVDLTDPSPASGWRNNERKALLDRGRPDLTLALALVHHLAITESIPLPEIVGWLADLGGATVVEFPSPEDPKVRALRAAKSGGAVHDYEGATFERALQERFLIDRRLVLPSGLRTLLFARPR